MVPRYKIFLQVAIFVAFVAALALPTVQPSQAADPCTLPDVEFLGEGEKNSSRTYVHDDEYDGFFVKRWDRNRTAADSEVAMKLVFEYVEQPEITLTKWDNGNQSFRMARVWQTTRPQQAPVFYDDGVIDLGVVENGETVDLVILDNDEFVTEIVNEDDSVLHTEAPNLVQYVAFVAPRTGKYYARSQGPIALAGICTAETEPTTTPTPSASSTETSTVTPTSTATRVQPTMTDTPLPPSLTPTATETMSPTATPIFAITQAPTSTPWATVTLTQLPPATATSIATPNLALTPVPTELTPDPGVDSCNHRDAWCLWVVPVSDGQSSGEQVVQ